MPGPPPSAGPPSSGDPSAAFARAVRRSPSTTMKLAIAGGGLIAVLLAFGALTLLKMAAESMGVLSGASSEAASSAPSFDPPPMATIAGPSQVVTVTLDAGRPPP